MILLTLFLIALVAGFGGLIWGWRMDRRERAALRQRRAWNRIAHDYAKRQYEDAVRRMFASRSPVQIAINTSSARLGAEAVLLALRRLAQHTDGR